MEKNLLRNSRIEPNESLIIHTSLQQQNNNNNEQMNDMLTCMLTEQAHICSKK